MRATRTAAAVTGGTARSILLVVLSSTAAASIAAAAGRSGPAVVLSGEQKAWHRVTLTFTGPMAREDGPAKPFLDHRLTVVFTNGMRSYVVPGFFAADGDAAETGAGGGDRWRVHFAPDAPGRWRWTAFFRSGPGVAIDDDPGAGRPEPPDGLTGAFDVAPSDKRGRDHRAKGRLVYTGRRYLVFAQTDEPFLKGGADSPENFLAYADFDGGGRHRYEPHVADWRPGDPTWRSGKGKGIVGALNYLASRGMNSVYFLTMNVGGDGKDVWPWTSAEGRLRYDCSKLDQWEIVFSQMDALGLMMHVVQQETENDHLLDGGALGGERRLYYRELVARFAHHLALQWNLGEENANSDVERKSFARYIRSLDPYDHPIVVHTSVARKEQERALAPLLGFPALEGPSLQIGDVTRVHEESLRWVERSSQKGRPWVVPIDEIGPAWRGVLQDAVDPSHEAERVHALWGNLMAGGAGAEWYLGSQEVAAADGSTARRWWDLEAEDWRGWERIWDQTRHALEFFRDHLPFAEMEPADARTSLGESYALARPGEVYAVYLWAHGTTDLDLGPLANEYEVLWFDPRNGGALQKGSVERVSGPGWRSLGLPPSEPGRDWAVLVRRAGARGGD